MVNNIKEKEKLLEIVRLLSKGYNPIKRRPFSKKSSMNSLEIRKALSKAYEALRYVQESEINFNSGKPWSRGDEKQLLNDYRSGISIRKLALINGRSEGAITSRLVKLGEIEYLRK